MTTLAFHRLLLLAALLVASTVSHAQVGVVSLGDKPDKDVEVRVGLVGLIKPSYLGSDETQGRVLPSFAAYSSSGWFVSVTNGIGWNFGNGKTIDYGLRLTYDLGRDENDSSRLRGMGDVKPRAELGGFFNYDFNRNLTLKTSLRYGSGNDSDGVLMDTALNFGFPVIEGTFGVVGLSTTYANASYMRSYFGVSPTQSLASGYAVYTPGAGLRDTSLNVSLFSRFSSEWSGFARLGVARLDGDVRNSPISLKPNYTTFALGTSYKF
jgi:MipA family protein